MSPYDDLDDVSGHFTSYSLLSPKDVTYFRLITAPYPLGRFSLGQLQLSADSCQPTGSPYKS